MALTRRVWGAGKLLLLAGALLATYLVFFAVAMRVAIKASEVQVPDLTGRTVNQATTILGDLGLALRVEETRRIHPRVPAGQVVVQDPAPGSRARRSRSVKVWLSEGPAAAVVPALVGESERTAQIRLQVAGLEVARVAEVRSADYPAGTVIAQSPPPDSRGSAVSLMVNRGEAGATYVMPDLIGVAGERAADVLRLRGFRVTLVGAQPYPGVPPGMIIRQSPQGGFQVAPGQPISLEVSR